jgi:hypothetical protein
LQAGVNTKGVNSAKKLANRPTRTKGDFAGEILRRLTGNQAGVLANRPTRTKGDFAGEILRRLTGNQAGVICKRVKSWQKIKFWGWFFGVKWVLGAVMRVFARANTQVLKWARQKCAESGKKFAKVRAF